MATPAPEEKAPTNLGRWKALPKMGLFIRHAPSQTADTNGILKPGEVVLALEKKGSWIRHERGWSLALKGKTALLTPVTDDDEELDALIYKFTGLCDELTVLIRRVKELQTARAYFSEAESNFAKVLAVMGSHQKADVKSVESVQKFHIMQQRLKDLHHEVDENIKKSVSQALDALRIDAQMIGKDISRFTAIQNRILSSQGRLGNRVEHFGDDYIAKSIKSSLGRQMSEYEQYEDQLLSTISILLNKKDNFLKHTLKTFSEEMLEGVDTCAKVSREMEQDSMVLQYKSDSKIRRKRFEFRGHVDVDKIIAASIPTSQPRVAAAEPAVVPHSAATNGGIKPAAPNKAPPPAPMNDNAPLASTGEEDLAVTVKTPPAERALFAEGDAKEVEAG